MCVDSDGGNKKPAKSRWTGGVWHEAYLPTGDPARIRRLCNSGHGESTGACPVADSTCDAHGSDYSTTVTCFRK